MHKTAAWPLAIIYAVLIVYASLYPFVEWRNQGIAPWEFLFAAIPKYWTGFDVGVNIAGYMPLGALLALAMIRSRFSAFPVLLAMLFGALLSFLMEALQGYLPMRVASREDWLLNITGTLFGAVLAKLLEKWGAIDRWSALRARWFVPQARGGIVLLATWPLALIFPSSVPLGVGQIWERLEHGIIQILQDTAFLSWMPLTGTTLQPLSPATEMLCVAFGLLIPCLLGFCIIRSLPRRLAWIVMALIAGMVVSAFSAALTWGPQHAWSWLDLPSQVGLGLGVAFALLFVAFPWRASAALLLLVLGLYLSMLNQAPQSPYFSQALQLWEQGRFIRFHGLAQWLGWFWPYVAMVYVTMLVVQVAPKK
jgi:VanZ family protein